MEIIGLKRAIRARTRARAAGRGPGAAPCLPDKTTKDYRPALVYTQFLLQRIELLIRT